MNDLTVFPVNHTVNLIVDFPNREEIDTAWAKEAEDRLDAYEKGKIGVKPAKEVFANVYRNPAELPE